MANYDHCLVCLKSNCNDGNLRSQNTRTRNVHSSTLRKCDSEIADDPHLLFSFLIFDLLEISKDNCVRLMAVMGKVEMSKLLVFCDGCKGMVEKAFKAHLQIMELKQLVTCWRQGVKQSLKEGLKIAEVDGMTGVYKKIWEIYQGKNIINDNLQLTISKSDLHIKVEPDDAGLRNDADVKFNKDVDSDSDWEQEAENTNAQDSDDSDFVPPPSSPTSHENDSNDANLESYEDPPTPDDNNKASLICRICNVKAYHARQLKQHLTYHKIRKKTSCTVCKYPCASFQHLYTHYKVKHPSLPPQGTKPMRKCHLLTQARNKNKAECHICHRMYIKSRIQEHVLSHAKSIVCEICNFKLKSESALLCHYSRKHPEDNPTKLSICFTWKCPDCDNYVAVSKSQKVTHMRQHRYLAYVTQSNGQFTCNFCSESHPSRMLICRHMRLNHKKHIYIARLTCTVCSQQFPTIRLLKRHLAVDHKLNNYICDKCGRKFRYEYQLAIHVADHSVTKFYCELCGLDFRSTFGLKLHQSRYHNGTPRKKSKKVAPDAAAVNEECPDMKKEVPPEPATTSTSRNNTCKVCGIQCCNYRAVLKHLREEHSELYGFTCSQCDMSFTQIYKLNEHTKIVHGEKQKCPHCDKTFSSGKGLRQHLKMKLCSKIPTEDTLPDDDPSTSLP